MPAARASPPAVGRRLAGDPLAGFSPLTRDWFTQVFSEPTPAQAGAWESIMAGDSTLVIAPTGSGKTLAAFLWALDRLATDPPPADPKLRCRVLYISPLKALAVDIERNLRAPLTGIRQMARRRGLPEPEVRVAVRTGDTGADERRKLATKPPDILITTPESLFLILTSRARDTLRAVDTVIVDEVHALAGGKRGAHLALSLERLDALGEHLPGRKAPAQRVGLSATVRPAEEVAVFLGGAKPVTVTSPPSAKRVELSIVVPVEDMTDPDSLAPPRAMAAEGGDGSEPPPAERRSIWPHVEERVLDLIEAHRSTIVFANSRRLAERLCGRLNELAADRAAARAEAAEGWSPGPPGGGAGAAGARAPAEVMAQAGTAAGAPAEVARAHHGSVSRQERAQIEEALKAGRLPAVVATSSLELGIDMGAVDLVIQVESPPSVASGLQRTGRAGHNVGDVSRGVIFPKYPGDLVAAAVVAGRMRTGEIEELRMPRNPLDVLAQQIVAMTAMDDWRVEDLWRVVSRAAPFSGLTMGMLSAVLDMLAGRYPSEEFADLRPRLVWDRASGVLRGRPGAQRLAVTSGGTIPDRGLFGVFLAGERRHGRQPHRVGELDEEMVYESRVGDVFVLGASSWRIEEITHDQVLVSPAPGLPGKLPFWHGDTAGRPAELGRAVGAFCREMAAMTSADAITALRAAGLDELAAGNLVRYLAAQREATGYVPDDRTLVLERFRDELGDWRMVLHSPYGARVHAPWALAIAARLRERYQGMDVQALHTDDGIVLRVPDTDTAPPGDVATLDPDEVEPLVTAELGGSALFASRFRECAARALLLPRRRPGKRSPLWQQRQRSAQLLAVAAQYGSFPVVLETVRECLRDTFDVPALTGLMRGLASREIRLVEVETPAASPFARSLLFRYVGAFMYEGDSPLAERRAQALALDSSLLAELLGQADLRELLDPAVVAETERELAHLTPRRACRDAEGLADLLRRIGPLTTAEVAARCEPPAAAAGWLAELAGARRAIQPLVAGEPRWAAIEDAGRLSDALGVPLPPGIPTAFTEPLPDPLGDLVARYARSHGPFTARAVAARYGLGAAVVTAALRRLAASQRVVEGEFLPGGRGAEWCDVEVLRLLRRRCLAKLRKETEPVPAEALAAFLPSWQRIRPEPAAGPAGTHGAGTRPDGGPGGDLGQWASHRQPGTSQPGASRPARPDQVYEAVGTLAGAPVPASALETLTLPGRVAGYTPAALDELTSAGEVIWAGAGGLPSGDGWVVLAPAHLAPLLLPPPAPVTMTPVHQVVLAALAGGGGLFFRTIAERVAAEVPGDGGPVPGAAVAAAVWDLVWAGYLTNDTLAPLRAVLGTGRPSYDGERPGPASRAAGGVAGPLRAPRLPRHGGRALLSRTSLGGPDRGATGGVARAAPPSVTGRWSLVPEREPEATRRYHAIAQVMLDRHGIVTKGAVVAERVAGGFAALYAVLRAMEEGGQCRRGYFVEGLGAAQFALPGAVDRMRALAPAAGGGEGSGNWASAGGHQDQAGGAVVLAAADPANPFGAALPWPERPLDSLGGHRPGRKAGALVVLRRGRLVLYVERGGKSLLSWSEDPADLAAAAAGLARALRGGQLGRVTVERADGAGVHGTPLADALASAGFRPTPRGLRLRA